jgi:hypothetical protein
MSHGELERRAGRPLSAQDVDRLAAMQVLWPTSEGNDGFRVDPGLLQLGVQLLDVPIPAETIGAAREVLLEHSRAVARELSRMFRDEVWRPHVKRKSDAEQVEHVRAMKSLSAHMQPVVVQALVTAFTRSLRDELRSWVEEEQ